MYPSTSTIHSFLYETGLTLASIVLDNRQRLYAYRLLSFLNQHSIKKILPISLKIGDEAFDKLLENDLM